MTAQKDLYTTVDVEIGHTPDQTAVATFLTWLSRYNLT